MFAQQVVKVAAALALAGPAWAVVQCAWQPTGGCSTPQWDVRWDMAGSTYTYCFGNCPLDWLANNTDLGVWGGVVGFDHYFTHQGMPCINGRPQELEHQDAITVATKATFPRAKVLQYRITSAVPYAGIVHDTMLTNPDYFVHWPNGSLCQMPYAEHQTGLPGDNCSWPIIASAYNWSNPNAQSWFLENVIAPTLNVADGAWIDGDGPDNGAWMCSGSYNYGNLPAPYPALNVSQIADFCAGEQAVVVAAQRMLIARGGFDYNCIMFVTSGLPSASDNGSTCAAKVTALSTLSAPAIVLYGSRTGNEGYDDATISQAVAVFLLTRQAHWFFSFQFPTDTPQRASAAWLLTDYGAPLGNMSVAGHVFTRAFANMTVSLDCDTFTATFTPPAAAVL